ncbi:MAG: DNA polymerase IV [Gammaproteobacteria bacterium]|nr:DNA polymerase IV [Gammaproteobacteria bacterium]
MSRFGEFTLATRKIVHIDMDAFYASVEQRDNPALRGKPVVVGGSPYSRGVVAACSYEAREFGVRSAMPCRQALSLCPSTVFVTPRFAVYKSVSEQIHEVFARYTDCVEPLSLDEAYLDVTDSRLCQGSATRIARSIKADIRRDTGLVASAGVSYNKFLAKIASDQDKPDGLFCILPEDGEAFVAGLPIGRFYGVGAVTEARMQSLGIENGADLRRWSLDELNAQFGKSGRYYFDIARGVDEREVTPERVRKSLGAETTFAQDLSKPEDMLEALQELADKVYDSISSRRLWATTLTVKVRLENFRLLTRSHSQAQPLSARRIHDLLPLLLTRALTAGDRVRLLGVSLSGLLDGDELPLQRDLFEDGPADARIGPVPASDDDLRSR